MKHGKRIRKAIYGTIFCYFAVMGLMLGILQATLQTRYILYGKDAVMAQCVINETAAGTEYTMQLGGGEWSFSFLQPHNGIAAELISDLPPCMAKLLLRMVTAAEYYTAECIQS